jgi:outer membrane biosynthesis protein TonB
MTAALLRERVSPVRNKMPKPPPPPTPPLPSPPPPDSPPVKGKTKAAEKEEQINSLIRDAREFEIRLDSTEKQNAFLQNQVSALESRFDTSEKKVVACFERLAYIALGASAAWLVHLIVT